MNSDYVTNSEQANESPVRFWDGKSASLITSSRYDVMWKILGILLFLATQLIVGANEANAASVSCSSSSVFNFAPSLSASGFARDAVVGTTTSNYSTNLNFNCSGDPSADRDIYVFFQISTSAPVSGYTNVFPTNVASVGVRYTISNGPGTSCSNSPSVVTTGRLQIVCHQLLQAVSPGQNYTLVVSAQFVKIANGPTGPLTTIPALDVQYAMNNQAGTTDWGNIFSGTVSDTFSTYTCSVTTPSVVVSVSEAKTNRLTSVGSTDGAGQFNIGLNCDPGVKAYMTLTDAVTPSNTSNVLSLGTDSTAKGIGYQILYSGSLVSFGPDSAAAGNLNQFSVMSSPATGGAVNISLAARIIRTGDLSPGTATGKATFTMSYQ